MPGDELVRSARAGWRWPRSSDLSPTIENGKRGTLTPCCVQLFLCGLRNFRRVRRADGFDNLEHPWLGASFTNDYTSWRCRRAQGMFAFQMRAQTNRMLRC